MNSPIQLSYLNTDLRLPTAQSLAAFPTAVANELASHESYNKHLYRPNTYLHKWWARRSGTTFRHILKHMVPDPAKRDYYQPGGLDGFTILDPMMGGATTLHEAIRLGANVLGFDIDPIPVLQAEATLTLLELPHKQRTFHHFFEMLRQELVPFFRTHCPICDQPSEAQFYLYALRRRCNCREVLVADSFTLRHNHGHDILLCPHCAAVYTGPDHHCQSASHLPLVDKTASNCPLCGAPYRDILDVPYVDRYVPLAIFGHCPAHGEFFKAVDSGDLHVIANARAQADRVHFDSPSLFAIPDGPKSKDLLARRVDSFLDLFSPRQRLYLDRVVHLLPTFIRDDRLWLALLASTSLEFNSLLCGYKGGDIRRPGAIRHVFSHHAYSFPYTALENNPTFSHPRSGTLQRLFRDRIVKAGQWAVRPVERRPRGAQLEKVTINGETDGGQRVTEYSDLANGSRRFFVQQADSGDIALPSGIVDYVVTDPPYFDNVQYSDLSTFFRVWLRLFLPDEADWHYDPLASAVSEGSREGLDKYTHVLGRIWRTCHHALKPTGSLVFTFHHWKPEAWAALTISLKSARFELVDHHVVFSENPTSVHIQGLNALQHDAILVLRPLSGDNPQRDWPPIAAVDASDSYAFCANCAQVVGWCLASTLNNQDITDLWNRLFQGGGTNYAKAPG